VGGGNPVRHEPVRVKDPSGVVHTYAYGSAPEAGLLKTITVPGGRKVTFLYAPGASVSLLNAVQDWAGRRWTFQYDDIGNLTEENAAGSRTTYLYDNENRLTSVRFPDGTRSTYTYAGGGLRRSAHEAGGSLTTFVWDEDDYLGEV
jgi:YD repeat-containing protein